MALVVIQPALVGQFEKAAIPAQRWDNICMVVYPPGPFPLDARQVPAYQRVQFAIPLPFHRNAVGQAPGGAFAQGFSIVDTFFGKQVVLLPAHLYLIQATVFQHAVAFCRRQQGLCPLHPVHQRHDAA